MMMLSLGKNFDDATYTLTIDDTIISLLIQQTLFIQ